MRMLVAGLLALLCALAFSLQLGAAAASVSVECDRPARLRLLRLEDGSARLQCGGRTLVRIHVPG